MATKKQSPIPGADRASKAYNKKVDAGLRLIKVWVAGVDSDPHGVEADKVRKYAAKQPITKSINKTLAN